MTVEQEQAVSSWPPDIGIDWDYEDSRRVIMHADCRGVLPALPADSVDLVVTDPPYGMSFMGKDWDKVLPDPAIWRECLRVLKPGAFAFVMSSPRADLLYRMIASLEGAGFNVGFTPIYWVYSSGFPKAQNIGKSVDKRLGAEREVTGIKDKRYLSPATATSGAPMGNLDPRVNSVANFTKAGLATLPSSPEAQALDGSYAGFQPKPAVEVIIVAMKPLSEKTYVDQALANGHGVTWLDAGRIPHDGATGENAEYVPNLKNQVYGKGGGVWNPSTGRFPANLLCSDDVLDDGIAGKATKPHPLVSSGTTDDGYGNITERRGEVGNYGDGGSFSRYFDLDAWWAERLKSLPESVQRTFPFLEVTKASKREKNAGLEDMPDSIPQWLKDDGRSRPHALSDPRMGREQQRLPTKNDHPTVKPIKLMSYLIELGSRPGDIVLDPFVGSGPALLAAGAGDRYSIGIERDESAYEIASSRCAAAEVDRIRRGED